MAQATMHRAKLSLQPSQATRPRCLTALYPIYPLSFNKWVSACVPRYCTYFHCLREWVREDQPRVPQEHTWVAVNTKDLSRRLRQGEGSSELGMGTSHSGKGRKAIQTDRIAQGKAGWYETTRHHNTASNSVRLEERAGERQEKTARYFHET